MVRARNDRNTPFPASWAKNDAAGPLPPPPPPCGMDTRSPMPSTTGSTTSTAEQGQVAPAPEHQAQLAAQQAEPGTDTVARPGVRGQCRATSAAGASPRGADSSAVDIESLPGEPDEQFLQAGPRRVQPGHRDARVDQLAADLLRRLVTERRA